MKKEFESRLEKIERALEAALNEKFSDEWKTVSFGDLPVAIKNEHLSCLVKPNKNLIDLGGKRWRPLLMVLTYEFVRSHHKETALSEEKVYSLVPLVEFVHTASLIHDDIEDGADLRRGKSCAHISFGLDTALNAGSWLYFEAPVCIENCALSEKQKNIFYRLYTNELRRLHLGQAMDIHWHRNPGLFPSVDEYMAMVRCKTGTLASLAAQLGAVAGGASEDEALKLGDIAANIGIGFQIIDDVINLKTGNAGKKRGDDIVEGKKSLPVLIHVQKSPADKEKISSLMQTASAEGIDSGAVEECIKILQSLDAIDEASKTGSNLIKKETSRFAGFYVCDDKCSDKSNVENSDEAGTLIVELFNSLIPSI